VRPPSSIVVFNRTAFRLANKDFVGSTGAAAKCCASSSRRKYACSIRIAIEYVRSKLVRLLNDLLVYLIPQQTIPPTSPLPLSLLQIQFLRPSLQIPSSPSQISSRPTPFHSNCHRFSSIVRTATPALFVVSCTSLLVVAVSSRFVCCRAEMIQLSKPANMKQVCFRQRRFTSSFIDSAAPSPSVMACAPPARDAISLTDNTVLFGAQLQNHLVDRIQ